MNNYTEPQKITDAQNIIYQIRLQNYQEASILLRKLILASLTDSIAPEDLALMKDLEAVLAADDTIYTADWLETVWIPFYQKQAIQNQQPSRSYGNYVMESTSSGWLTLQNCVFHKYYHSNNNPMEEARLLVDKVYEPEQYHYAVWGLGLGYHVLQLYEAACGSIDITVFYGDPCEYQAMLDYGLLAAIPPQRLHMVEDPKAHAFSAYIAENKCGILLHFPSILCMADADAKQAMHTFFAHWNSAKQQVRQLAVNFRSNRKLCTHNVDELQSVFFQKDLLLLGGGPSIDSGLEYIRKSQGHKWIIAATTVLHKLLQAGIHPDYTIVMDPQPRTIGHFVTEEDCSVPMILVSTAYWEFAQRCHAEKYIAYQAQYEKSEAAALAGGHSVYETGGSVTTLALELAARLGASRIELLGIDLSYPSNHSHASGTMDQRTVDSSDLLTVKDVHGKETKTDILFLTYKKWMENKIKQYPMIQFVNLSDCGAHIEGTIENQL